jgi:riboflavin biosynthesis pyrimidine reductase
MRTVRDDEPTTVRRPAEQRIREPVRIAICSFWRTTGGASLPRRVVDQMLRAYFLHHRERKYEHAEPEILVLDPLPCWQGLSQSEIRERMPVVNIRRAAIRGTCLGPPTRGWRDLSSVVAH